MLGLFPGVVAPNVDRCYVGLNTLLLAKDDHRINVVQVNTQYTIVEQKDVFSESEAMMMRSRVISCSIK